MLEKNVEIIAPLLKFFATPLFGSLCVKAEAWLKEVKGGCNH